MSKGEARQTNQKHRKYYDLVNTREFKLQTTNYSVYSRTIIIICMYLLSRMLQSA